MSALSEMHHSLAMLFSELIDGPPKGAAYILNGGDIGLLRSLDRLSAAAASATPSTGGASIAAHVDHLCYGMELMNRWSRGETNPWATADWAASWRHRKVDEKEWAALRERLRTASAEYVTTLGTPRELPEVARSGMIGGVAHLAYHFGAIRQIDRSIRGPAAE